MPISRLLLTALLTLAAAPDLAADPIRCDLASYKASKGLTAAIADDVVVLTWQGDRARELRLRLAIADGRPLIRDLAIRGTGAAWAVLGENLTPEYHVVTGVRRMTTQQADRLRAL
jgi:hypothetical protein